MVPHTDVAPFAVCLAGSFTNGSSGSQQQQQQQQQQQGYSSAGQGWCARWFKQQQGVTRYNCADSLDRTNVGSFFGAVQVRPANGQWVERLNGSKANKDVISLRLACCTACLICMP